jgi:hypothetical protein
MGRATGVGVGVLAGAQVCSQSPADAGRWGAVLAAATHGTQNSPHRPGTRKKRHHQCRRACPGIVTSAACPEDTP